MAVEVILVHLFQVLALLEWAQIEDPVLPPIIKGAFLCLRDPLDGALSRILPKRIMPVRVQNVNVRLASLIICVLIRIFDIYCNGVNITIFILNIYLGAANLPPSGPSGIPTVQRTASSASAYGGRMRKHSNMSNIEDEPGNILNLDTKKS
jgi:hypothetical protein